MKKDTRVIWRAKLEDPENTNKVTTPGGSGVTLTDEVDGKVSVCVQTESWGDGKTLTVMPRKAVEFPVSELIVDPILR